MEESRKFYSDYSFHWKKNALKDVAKIEEEVLCNQEKIIDYEKRIKHLDEENARNMKKVSKIMKLVREREKSERNN